MIELSVKQLTQKTLSTVYLKLADLYGQLLLVHSDREQMLIELEITAAKQLESKLRESL